MALASTGKKKTARKMARMGEYSMLIDVPREDEVEA